MTSELAAAILALKEMYESESAGPTDLNRPREGERNLPGQPADNASSERDPTRAWAGEAKTRERLARAMAAVATEHEMRLAAEAEFASLRAELELTREQLRDAVHQTLAAEERAERAGADVMQLRRASFQRWLLLSGIVVALLLSGWLLRFSTQPAQNAAKFVVAAVQNGWDAARQNIQPKSQPTTQSASKPATEQTEATALPRSVAPNLDAGQSLTPADKPIGGEPGQVHVGEQAAADSSLQRNSGDRSQSVPQKPSDQQQPAVAAPAEEAPAEQKPASSSKTSADTLPEAGQIQPKASDPMAQNERTDAQQATAQVNIEPQQPAPAPPDNTKTPASGSTTPQSPSPSTAPTSAAANETATKGNAVAETAVAHVSIHYEQSSSSAHADAERVAALLVHAGFGGSQLLSTQHVTREPVVRYFFPDDAEAAKSIATELRKKDSRWQAEDCTHYRHKPPAGSIQVWPARI